MKKWFFFPRSRKALTDGDGAHKASETERERERRDRESREREEQDQQNIAKRLHDAAHRLHVLEWQADVEGRRREKP